MLSAFACRSRIILRPPNRAILAASLSRFAPRQPRDIAQPHVAPAIFPPSNSKNPTLSPDEVLQHGLKKWHESPKTATALTILGLPKAELPELLQRFRAVAQQELDGLNNLSPVQRDQWAIDYIRANLTLDPAHGVQSEDLGRRAIMRRFLLWASEQAITAGHPAYPALFSSASHLAQVAHYLDLRNPASLYPRARQKKRNIVMHVGPTNSGKTYRALVALASAKSGKYLGPLRLLAYEIYYRLNNGLISIPNPDGGPPLSENKACHLITGDQHRMEPGADFASMTVEMCNPDDATRVAVVDEIQMIADNERGGSWTRVVLGESSNEIHLCGEATAVPLVRKLLESTGDNLVVNNYERLTPLTMESRDLGDLRNVKPGDCVVAFRRADLFWIKAAIEKKTGLKCAMVYGGLPPETRAEQAQLFNDKDSGYDVLVASDAVGMGLNLKIKRVIFWSVDKTMGQQRIPLSTSQIKQIAGRAGRYGSQGSNSEGSVTCLQRRDMRRLERALAAPVAPLPHAVLDIPNDSVLGLGSLIDPATSVKNLFDLITDFCLVMPPFKFPGLQKSRNEIIELFERYGRNLPLENILSLLFMPVNQRMQIGRIMVNNILRTDTRNASVTVRDAFRGTGLDACLKELQALREAWQAGDDDRKKRIIRRVGDQISDKLVELEQFHKGLVLYSWLQNRNSISYGDWKESDRLKRLAEDLIDFLLELTIQKKSSREGRRTQPLDVAARKFLA